LKQCAFLIMYYYNDFRNCRNYCFLIILTDHYKFAILCTLWVSGDENTSKIPSKYATVLMNHNSIALIIYLYENWQRSSWCIIIIQLQKHRASSHHILLFLLVVLMKPVNNNCHISTAEHYRLKEIKFYLWKK